MTLTYREKTVIQFPVKEDGCDQIILVNDQGEIDIEMIFYLRGKTVLKIKLGEHDRSTLSTALILIGKARKDKE